MSTIDDLKRDYGLVTAADLPPRPKPADDHVTVRERWSQHKRLAFKAMAPHALCVVATEGPVSAVTYNAAGGVGRRFGHNRGCWPMRLAASRAWEDTVTNTYNKNPFVRTGVQIRVWTKSEAHVKRLILPISDLLGAMAEEALGSDLINGFVDVGPDLQMELLELEIHDVAKRARIVVWDDEGLSAYLDKCVYEAEVLRVTNLGAR